MDQALVWDSTNIFIYTYIWMRTKNCLPIEIGGKGNNFMVYTNNRLYHKTCTVLVLNQILVRDINKLSNINIKRDFLKSINIYTIDT